MPVTECHKHLIAYSPCCQVEAWRSPFTRDLKLTVKLSCTACSKDWTLVINPQGELPNRLGFAHEFNWSREEPRRTLK